MSFARFIFNAIYTVGATSLTLAGLSGARMLGYWRGTPMDDLRSRENMEQFLRAAGLDVTVVSVGDVEPMQSDGAMSQNFSVALKVSGPDARRVPTELVFKTRQPAFSMQGMLLEVIGAPDREPMFYTHLAPTMAKAGVRLPRCFGVRSDVRGECLVLERVQGIRNFLLTDGLPGDRVPAVMAELARFHSVYWMGVGLADETDWPPGVPIKLRPGPEFRILLQLLRMNLRADLAGNLPAGAETFPEIVLDVLRVYLDLAWTDRFLDKLRHDHLVTLCMVDTNLGNFLFSTSNKDEVTLIDFQGVNVSSPLADIFTFMPMLAAAPDTVKQACEDHLTFYHGQLRSHGVRDLPDLDSAAWKRECMMGLAQSTWLTALGVSMIRSGQEMTDNVRAGIPVIVDRFANLCKVFNLLDFMKSL